MVRMIGQHWILLMSDQVNAEEWEQHSLTSFTSRTQHTPSEAGVSVPHSASCAVELGVSGVVGSEGATPHNGQL